jgi:GNAT superfamily N-acetyltransferase
VKQIDVTRTYLEMTHPDQLRAVPVVPPARVECVERCPLSFYRYLYREVGRNYRWTDRLAWSDEQLRSHLATPGVSVWVMYAGGSPAGYFELHARGDRSTEIAYFGLLPEFIGQGLGKQLLTAAVERAWDTGAKRVWLHTCTLDDPAAMPNYLKRGFKPFKEEKYFTTVSAEEEAAGKWRKAT